VERNLSGHHRGTAVAEEIRVLDELLLLSAITLVGIKCTITARYR